MPSVILLSVTAIRTAMVVITTGVMNMGKKSSVRIDMIRHDPSVTARFLDNVLASNFFPYE